LQESGGIEGDPGPGGSQGLPGPQGVKGVDGRDGSGAITAGRVYSKDTLGGFGLWETFKILVNKAG